MMVIAHVVGTIEYQIRALTIFEQADLVCLTGSVEIIDRLLKRDCLSNKRNIVLY